MKRLKKTNKTIKEKRKKISVTGMILLMAKRIEQHSQVTNMRA